MKNFQMTLYLIAALAGLVSCIAHFTFAPLAHGTAGMWPAIAAVNFVALAGATRL
jgi:hypothetical protein